MDSLWAISSIDGRYRKKTEMLAPYLSEGALITYRVKVEASWLLFLNQYSVNGSLALDLDISSPVRTFLTNLCDQISETDIKRIKELEIKTNHDVKAVEYFLREKLQALGASKKVLSFIHFAATSEDINNIAYACMLYDVTHNVLLPQIKNIQKKLVLLAKEYHQTPMLSRTHGQTASPTTVGKEFAIFCHRLERSYEQLSELKFLGKFSGAVGHFNAHHVAYPDVDWCSLTKEFVEQQMGLTLNPLTTQIESHDYIAEFCDILKRYQSVGLGLTRDMWTYISLGYFKLKVKSEEVGSSTMPHKVNPIDFENAEGNFGLSIALCEHLASKLVVSRLQRDLSDSTVLRNLGTLLGHFLLALTSLAGGLEKISCDVEKISKDLDGAWEVLGEALQTVLRKNGMIDSYEFVKDMTRGKAVTQKILVEMIDASSALSTQEKARLRALTPRDYVGLAPEITLRFCAEWEQKNLAGDPETSSGSPARFV